MLHSQMREGRAKRRARMQAAKAKNDDEAGPPRPRSRLIKFAFLNSVFKCRLNFALYQFDVLLYKFRMNFFNVNLNLNFYRGRLFGGAGVGTTLPNR
jgi:hypothetical protein